jgi:hypothetical protein
VFRCGKKCLYWWNRPISFSFATYIDSFDFFDAFT